MEWDMMRLPDRKCACHWLTIGHGKWDCCWEKNVVTGVTHFLLIMEWDVMRLPNWNKWSATHFLLVLRLLMMRLPGRKGLTPWYEVWWDCLAENWVQLTPFFNRMRCDKTGWHKCFSFTHFLWVIEQDFMRYWQLGKNGSLTHILLVMKWVQWGC